MRKAERIVSDRYIDVEYHQFTQSRGAQWAARIAGVVSWPIVMPLAAVSRASDFLFLTCSQLLAVVPYIVGTIMRYEFYRWTLKRCGRNVMIGFGTVFLYRDIELGDDVLFGMYNTVHYCDFGSNVLIGDGCRFLSGSKYHNFSRTDIPMTRQGGKLRRITVGDDCWIGANAVIMTDVNDGGIVGAGSVVTRPVETCTIVGGNPAAAIRKRS
jgi:acetyltransferase-like isoleucine patch superfamily enzyme